MMRDSEPMVSFKTDDASRIDDAEVAYFRFRIQQVKDPDKRDQLYDALAGRDRDLVRTLLRDFK